MIAYLVANAPARSQFRTGRRAKPTGVTVLHTAESVMDKVGPDTGAESVARFIATRTTAGSYHDLVDSDSAIQLVRYRDEAFQDGTGSNPWALSISFALAAHDWPTLSETRRNAFLEHGAIAYRRQQAWLGESGFPLTPLRRITRAQSKAGIPGFVTHGDRDPGRRSDPGGGFPWAGWFRACAPDTPAPTVKEDDVARLVKSANAGALYATDGMRRWYVPSAIVRDELRATGVYGDGQVHILSQATLDAIPLQTP